jgi:hypothetical protein
LYDGELKGGLRCGAGTMTYASGNTYTGQWKDDQPGGQGSLVDRQLKLVYDGEFVRGQKHGRGRCQWADKTGSAHASYDGQWEENLRHGQGHYVEHNVAFKTADSVKRITITYDGSWARGVRCGAGKQWYTDQNSEARDFAVYEGSWMDDQHNGFGVLTDDQGSYRGEWLKGQRHGQGVVLNAAREELFNGEFLEGRRVNPAPSSSRSSSKPASSHSSLFRSGSAKPTSYPQSFSPNNTSASAATTGESAASGLSPHPSGGQQPPLPPPPRR